MVLKQGDQIPANLAPKIVGEDKLCRVRVDMDYVDSMISNLTTMIEHEPNRVKANRLKAYLKEVRPFKYAYDNFIRILWSIDPMTGAFSFPIKLKDYMDDPLIGVGPYECLNLGQNQSIANVRYKDLANIIAFEMMHRDLGESHKSIEAKLKDVGILSKFPCKIILDIIDKQEPYKDSKFMRIENSICYNKDTNEMYDYFRTSSQNTDLYQIPVGRSIQKALSIILATLMQNLDKTNIRYSLCLLDGYTLGFLIDKRDKKAFEEAVSEEVTVRVFGRLFDTYPTIDYFERSENGGE